MSWFSRRKEQQKISGLSMMAEAFGKALGGILQSQAQQMETQTKFLGVVSDLSAKQAAKIMGQKGGRVTQERKRQAKKAAQTTDCVLCINPMHRGTTMEQINFHRLHEGLDNSKILVEQQQPPEVGN